MAWVDLQLPEQQLADMLVECQTWRAIVAAPTAVWSDIAATMDSGTVAVGEAASKVVTSLFEEREDAAAFIEMPRAVASHQESDSWTRTSTSGADLAGQVYLLVELTIPPALENDRAAAKDDIRRKAAALMIELFNLGRVWPRLDLEGAEIDAGIVYPQENNGKPIGVIQGPLRFRGVSA